MALPRYTTLMIRPGQQLYRPTHEEAERIGCIAMGKRNWEGAEPLMREQTIAAIPLVVLALQNLGWKVEPPVDDGELS
jgi:hypothetical protein